MIERVVDLIVQSRQSLDARIVLADELERAGRTWVANRIRDAVYREVPIEVSRVRLQRAVYLRVEVDSRRHKRPVDWHVFWIRTGLEPWTRNPSRLPSLRSEVEGIW